MTTKNGLVAATDEHFAWLLGAGAPASVHGVTVAAGGIEAPEVLEMLRGVAARVRAAFQRGQVDIATPPTVRALLVRRLVIMATASGQEVPYQDGGLVPSPSRQPGPR